MSCSPLIRLEKVTKIFDIGSQGSVIAVKDINLEISKGETLAIVGPSGAGKTTILRMIAGIIPPTSGTIRFLEHNIEYARVNGLLSYIPQSLSLMQFRTVYENIALPLELKGIKQKDRISDLIKLCGLTGFENFFPADLSGGMKQKTAIARALSINPEVLIIDEPFASLDEMVKEKLNEEMIRIQSVLHTTIIYVTHNIEEACFLSDKVAILSKEKRTISKVIPVNLPKERVASLRLSTDFFDQTSIVRKALKAV